ncbi:peptide ABC transporter permease [Frondihabitans sucicola]|uniref:Peptide ABC transporter permease n=1 Tax=Frondihabitans sucicola TaxID=1268041 RepID=A0ABN6Y6Q7_9MICO|nr:peptide ABC transporter permease [Frondihabitans sucicola]
MLLSGLQGVLSNKLRSILTLLGVLIGVGAVILLLAVGNGSAQQVAASIDSLGTNTLTVRATGGQGSGTSQQITTETSSQLANAGLGHVSSVVPEATTTQTVSSTNASETDISIIGTTPDYFTVTTATVAEGTAFTTSDVTSGARDAVVGQTLATELFPTGTALGRSISVDGSPFTVTGILSEQSSTGFTDPNSELIAPITRVQESFSGYGAVSSLLVAAKSSGDVTAAEDETTIELNQLLGATTADEPFTVSSASTLLATQAASAKSFTVLLGVVAAISLLVGGIGVTNVMLVTVTERTREIGIRKALGATRPAILGQFLVEAAMLTLIGGILGVVLAVIGAQFTIDGTTPVILGFSIPLALGVSVAIGVFFGVYPAARAAAMRPIQALRSI